jgi:hypothetical protein
VLIAAGRHMTGLCGFCIGEDQVTDLTHRADLLIREIETGLSVYRRVSWSPLPRKVLHLETRLVPRADFDRRAARGFQAGYHGIDRLGHETAQQAFLLNGIGSVYLSGRLHAPPYAYLIERGFEVMLAVRDPYEELADRLLALADPAAVGRQGLSERDRLVFGPVIEALDDLDIGNPAAVRRRFRRLDRGLGAILSNPLARQLTTSRPDQLCSGDAASAALRTLSGFDLVAVDDVPGLFEHAAAHWLGTAATEADAGVDGVVAALRTSLADELSTLRPVEAMLDIDLEVHHAVATAVEAMLDQSDTGSTT